MVVVFCNNGGGCEVRMMKHIKNWLTGAGIFFPLILAGLPGSTLPIVPRPELEAMRRAIVLDVVNYNTLIVEIFGEPEVQKVQILGVDGLPKINPSWTQLTDEMPVAEYNAGQYLEDTLAGREIYLEIDPQVIPPKGVVPAYLWRGQTLINQMILFHGHGLLSASPEPVKYQTALAEAAQAAKQQGRGVWTFYGPRPSDLR